MTAAGADVLEVVGKGIRQGRALGGAGGLEARPIEAREGVGVGVDHLRDRLLQA